MTFASLSFRPDRPSGRTSMGDAPSGGRARLSGVAAATVSTRPLDTGPGVHDALALPREFTDVSRFTLAAAQSTESANTNSPP